VIAKRARCLEKATAGCGFLLDRLEVTDLFFGSGEKWEKVAISGVSRHKQRHTELFRLGAGMFQGTFNLTLDDKGRLALPATQRELLSSLCGGLITVTKNPLDAGCLWVFPRPEWERVKSELATLNNAQPGHRMLRRQLTGMAADLEPDGGGRILLPPTLREVAALDKRCVLVGLGDKYELWNDDAWRQMAVPLTEAQLTPEILALKI
jgi:MraZ protein